MKFLFVVLVICLLCGSEHKHSKKMMVPALLLTLAALLVFPGVMEGADDDDDDDDDDGTCSFDPGCWYHSLMDSFGDEPSDADKAAEEGWFSDCLCNKPTTTTTTPPPPGGGSSTTTAPPGGGSTTTTTPPGGGSGTLTGCQSGQIMGGSVVGDVTYDETLQSCSVRCTGNDACMGFDFSVSDNNRCRLSNDQSNFRIDPASDMSVCPKQ